MAVPSQVSNNSALSGSDNPKHLWGLSVLCDQRSEAECSFVAPEVHVAQYPLDMGRSDNKSNKTLAVSVGDDGHVNYDALLRQGANRDKIVHADHLALVPKVDKMKAEVRGAAAAAGDECSGSGMSLYLCLYLSICVCPSCTCVYPSYPCLPFRSVSVLRSVGLFRSRSCLFS